MTAANAAVHVHFNLFAHGIDNSGQGFNAALGTIELAATMVANDHGIGATRNGQTGIFHILNALQNDLAAPTLFDPFHIAPIEAGIELLSSPG